MGYPKGSIEKSWPNTPKIQFAKKVKYILAKVLIKTAIYFFFQFPKFPLTWRASIRSTPPLKPKKKTIVWIQQVDLISNI